MAAPNRVHRLVTSLNKLSLPPVVHRTALSLAFNTRVKLAMTCGIQVAEITDSRAQVHLRNRLRVQNHIGSVHACGMALLAESATALVFAMNVPDTSVQLVKSMRIDYKKRAVGDLLAVATLTPEQVR